MAKKAWYEALKVGDEVINLLLTRDDMIHVAKVKSISQNKIELDDGAVFRKKHFAISYAELTQEKRELLIKQEIESAKRFRERAIIRKANDEIEFTKFYEEFKRYKLT